MEPEYEFIGFGDGRDAAGLGVPNGSINSARLLSAYYVLGAGLGAGDGDRKEQAALWSLQSTGERQPQAK